MRKAVGFVSDRERAAIEAAAKAYWRCIDAMTPGSMSWEKLPEAGRMEQVEHTRAAVAAYNAALQEQGACSQCGGKRWMAKPRSPGTTVCNACNGTGKGPERVVPQDATQYQIVKRAIFEELLRQAAARGERPQGDEQTYRLIHSDRAGALALAVLAVHRPVPQDEGR